MKNESDDMAWVVTDIEKFVNQTRKIVFGAFGKQDLNEENADDFISELTDTDSQELDKTLGFDECLAIFNSHVKPVKSKSGKKKYIISDSVFGSIIEDFNSRLVSNLLKQLVSKGLIESAYDEEANDFIFWVKDEDENKKDKTN